MPISLQPFSSAAPNLQLTATMERNRENTLTLHYHLQADGSQLVIPSPASHPTRRHGLWETTCFEFFLGLTGDDRYWEFNLCPNGDWNVYRFDRYRQGMVEEAAIATLPFTVDVRSDVITLALTCSLAPLVPIPQSLQAAITTVIAQPDGNITYWAVAHCGSEADFHRRDSFVVSL